jgi:hypothetical protein
MTFQNPSELFFGQFYISESAECPFPAWTSRRYRTWYIHHHPVLREHDIMSGNGPAGLFLGYVIDDRFGLAEDGQALQMERNDEADLEKLEEFIYERGGRFICLLTYGDRDYLFLDPAGNLACVYDPLQRIIASTNTLIHCFATGKIPEHDPPLGSLKANQFYPAGLTDEAHIHRLLPNHCLDMQSFTAQRHWPKAFLAPFTESESRDALEAIARQVHFNVTSVAKKKQVYIGITAGKDSRMLLATCHDVKERVALYTFDYGDKRRSHDAGMGAKVARHAGLPHQVIQISKADDETKVRYLNKIGYNGSAGKSKDFLVGCTKFDMDQAMLPGFSGEIGRAYYRMYQYGEVGNQTVEHFLFLLHIPDREPYRSAVAEWHDSVKNLVDEKQIFDLLFLEHRTGCWSSVHYYGFAPMSVLINPFSHRRIYSNMIRLYDEHKLNQELPRTIIEKYWPELSELPYVTAKRPDSSLFGKVIHYLGEVRKKL